MPTPADEVMYSNAVEWIHKHPEDKRLSEEIKENFSHFNELSPKDKAALITALHRALETTGLPEEIKQSLPYLSFDLGALIGDLLPIIKNYLNESDARSLASVSRKTHAFLQGPNRLLLLDKFLQRVAYGKQDKVETLFTDVYRDKEGKIQEALLHQGRFTDYSGRTFNCSAYEYAYWAKDTHMCRMLERYMDGATKEKILARVEEIERTGLSYTQHGAPYRTHHFDFTPLIHALQFYVDNYDAWYAASNWVAMEAAWMEVGKAQRDVPAHVAQEYCHPTRAFYPCPLFNEPALPRLLTFYNRTTEQHVSWFPLTAPNSGLGIDFALIRPGRGCGMMARAGPWPGGVRVDLAAISRLDEVRTTDLTQSRENLKPPAMAQGMSV